MNEQQNMTKSLIEQMIDEEEHGLMLVGRYRSTAKRTATMILADNRTIVGKILTQGNFEFYDEDLAYVAN